MIFIIIYLILLAALHAKLELMIEGRKCGWAHNLPCWRLDNLITQFFLGKELTGYHLYLFLGHLNLKVLFWDYILFIGY
jgi:hypothetical protein